MERLKLIAKNRRRLLRRREQLHRAYTNETPYLDWDNHLDCSDEGQQTATIVECKELRAIDDALDRIREGVYGECADCGLAISEQHLTQQPLAKMCDSCKKSHEFAYRNPLFV